MKAFFNKLKEKTVNLSKKVREAFAKFFKYIKSLDLKILITLGVMLILILGLLVTVIIYAVKSTPASKEVEQLEFSANYEGNLINIYSDEYTLFPYGNLAYSNDGANRKITIPCIAEFKTRAGVEQ